MLTPAPTKKIQFNRDTVVDPQHVPARHCGRLQLRAVAAAPGVDPSIVGSMEYYFPAGTVLELHDFTIQGHADDVHPETTEASPTPGTTPEFAPRLRQIKSTDVTNRTTDGDTVRPDDAAASPPNAITAANTIE